MNFYPTYFRKGPVCIKRESARSGKKVDLSGISENTPFKAIETPDKNSFDQLVSAMEMVSFETYERFLILLHKKAQYEAKSFRETHTKSPEFVNPVPRRSYE